MDETRLRRKLLALFAVTAILCVIVIAISDLGMPAPHPIEAVLRAPLSDKPTQGDALWGSGSTVYQNWGAIISAILFLISGTAFYLAIKWTGFLGGDPDDDL